MTISFERRTVGAPRVAARRADAAARFRPSDAVRLPAAAQPASPVPRVVPPRSKRPIDVLVSAAAVIATSPLMALIAIAVRATSRGPAFFRQVRVGRDRVPFSMLKFRTMAVHNDDAIHREYVTAMWAHAADPPDGDPAAAHKLTDDPRVTPLGRWLRRTSLDELPQLINVLLGEMSLVGPRPVLPWEVELFASEHHSRFAVLPGMTGLWQISGRSRLTMRDAAALDVLYVESMSTRTDVHILLRTLPEVLRAARTGSGAA